MFLTEDSEIGVSDPPAVETTLVKQLKMEALQNETSKELPDNYEDFVKELNELFEEVKPYVSGHEKLSNNLKHLQQGAGLVGEWAKDYDYKDIQANGYWSALRIGVKMARLVCAKYQDVRDGKVAPPPIDAIDQTLVLLTDYFSVAIEVLKILREDSAKNGFALQASSVGHFTELFNILLTLDEKMVAAMYGRYCGFWLCNSSRYVMIACVTAFSILSDGFTNSFKCIFNPEYRGLVLARLVKSADIGFLKKLGFLMELPVYTQLLPYILFRGLPQVNRECFIERQREWLLSVSNKKVMRNLDCRDWCRQRMKPVRCKLFQGTGPHRDSLVFHCHGGGFVMGSPESHEVYLRDWATRLNGIPILSVDYSVSPKAKFPTALQEILDVYLWVTSRKSKVKELLGFHPTRIVLTGDSAGGNLISALSLVLNDIKHNANNSARTIMPKALVCVYTPFNLTLHLSPSMILASCDGFISAGVMLSCFEAYLPDVSSSSTSSSCSLDYTKLSDSKYSYSVIPFNEYKLQVYETIKKILEFIKSIKEYGKPKRSWYLEDKVTLKPKVERLYQITSNPYISPLCYKDFDSMSDVSLHMVALHYDPFLDDNVAMAKLWKGPVTLDVLDSLQHGFLNMTPFVPEARKAANMIYERLENALKDD